MRQHGISDANVAIEKSLSESTDLEAESRLGGGSFVSDAGVDVYVKTRR